MVVESDEQLAKTSLVTVMPMTSKVERKMPDDIFIVRNGENLLFEDSLIKVYDIMSFDQQRFFHKIGDIKEEALASIKSYLKKHFALYE